MKRGCLGDIWIVWVRVWGGPSGVPLTLTPPPPPPPPRTMAAVGFEEFSAPPGSELALPPLFGGHILEGELEAEVEFEAGGGPGGPGGGGEEEDEEEEQRREEGRRREEMARRKLAALGRRCRELEQVRPRPLHRPTAVWPRPQGSGPTPLAVRLRPLKLLLHPHCAPTSFGPAHLTGRPRPHLGSQAAWPRPHPLRHRPSLAPPQ